MFLRFAIFPASLLLHLRVEGVPEAVADEVEGHDGEADEQADRHPDVGVLQHALRGAGDRVYHGA